MYEETGGDIIHPDGDEPTHFIAAHGVYLMKMLIPKTYVEKTSEPPDGPLPCAACVDDNEDLHSACPCSKHKPPEGFGRQGP